MMDYDKLTTAELIELSEQLEESGTLEEALNVWRLASEREPDPVTLCRLGALATQLENWAEAERALVWAKTLAPEMPSAHSLLGFLYLDQSQPNKALENLQKAVELERNPPRLTALGVAQLEVGRIDQARKNFNEALIIDPNYDEALYNLGLTFRDQEPVKAVELFEGVLNKDPEHSNAHRELGWVRHMLNEEAEAEYHLRKAIELDEFDAWAYIYLGNLLWSRRDIAAAENQFKTAITVWPDEPIPYWCLAIFYEYEGRREKANHFYQQALVVGPDDPQANKLFGVYLNDIGKPAKAKAYLERAHSLDPEDQRICDILATLT